MLSSNAKYFVMLFLLLPVISGAGPARDPIAALCAAGVEGTYMGTFGAPNSPARFNIVCLDDERIAIAIQDSSAEPAFSYNLTNPEVEGDALVIAMFATSEPDRQGVPAGSAAAYVNISISALTSGTISGYFMGGSLPAPLNIAARRTVALPVRGTLPAAPVDPASMRGIYTLPLPGSPTTFWFDMINGIPIVYINTLPMVIHLIDGTPWDGTAAFTVSTTFGDSSITTFNLVTMRGSVTKGGSLQVYLVDSTNGVRGPFVAVKR
jgi:hypothetical protein